MYDLNDAQPQLPPVGERLANGSAHDFFYERDHLRLVAYAGLVA